MSEVVWRADEWQIARSRVGEFMAQHGLGSWDALVEASLDDPDWFWNSVVDFLEIPFTRMYTRVHSEARGKEWATWFDDGTVNLASACLDRWVRETPHSPAVIGEREDGSSTSLDFVELADRVSRLAGGLARVGVGRGDAVAVFVPMSPEAVTSFLAVAHLGAVFVPIFSGYGPEAIATRLSDPRPAAIIAADGFQRRGRLVEAKEIADEAISLAGGLDAMVVVPYAGRTDLPWTEGRDHAWADLIGGEPIPAAETGSEDPVLLAYTSGTTGRPKGAVHVHGGFTVKLAEEGAFQGDFGPGDRVAWLTDMGWIMGPWITTAGLANGACVVTFDGAPDHPGPDRAWAFAAKHRLTFLGVSPTLIRALQPYGAEISAQHDLSSLRAFGSTGEPWNPDPWWWLFRDVGRERIPIINLSGGTEIGACILSASPVQGIKPTSLGGPSLGMAAVVLDADGRRLGPGEGVGELAIERPWPGMTRGFWGEPERYIETYWSRVPGTWVHGDWASIDEDGFWYLHGRSDDTLNIAGKRIGPAELESVAVARDDVVMAAAVGIPDPIKGEAVAVFVVPAPGADPERMPEEIANAIADTLGKAFRPKLVRVVDDLPRTRSAKILRRVVRSLTLGEDPGDLSSLENPGSLAGIRPLER